MTLNIGQFHASQVETYSWGFGFESFVIRLKNEGCIWLILQYNGGAFFVIELHGWITVRETYRLPKKIECLSFQRGTTK